MNKYVIGLFVISIAMVLGAYTVIQPELETMAINKHVAELTASNVPSVTVLPTDTPVPGGAVVAQVVHMTTLGELTSAIDTYRASHGLSHVSPSNTLCDIAQKRASELNALGHLDQHAGSDKYFDSQHEYSSIGEVLEGAGKAVSGTQVVEWLWDKSPSHKDIISDPNWHFGCGGVAGYFTVYEFAN